MLVIGLGLGVLALPPLLGALFDGRPPRTAAIAVMVASGLIVAALATHPGGYRIGDVPHVIYGVIARVLN